MRIGYIIPDVGISGGLNVVLTHANFLLACGHDVFLVAMAPDTTISWRKNLCPIFSWTDENIWILVHSQPNDFIIATAWQTAFPLLGRHFLANHYVYFVQSDERRFYTPGTVEAQLAGVTYGMKCSYLTEAKWIKGWLSEYGIDAYYARNGVDRQIFRPCDPIIPRSKKLRVLLEGPISIPFKRVRDAYVAVSGLDVEIWLVSSDGGPDVSMKVDRFFEKVPLAVMPKIYSSCDVLIKLSEVEGMFGPPLEMMACGGTAITSDVNGHDEFMKHGVNGFVCKKGDIRSVRSYVNRLIDDKDLLAKLQKGGIETANQFDWHSTLQRVEEWLTSLNKLTNVDAESVLTPVDSFRDAVAICTKSFEKLYSYPPSFQCQVGLGFSLDPKGVYLVEASGWSWPPKMESAQCHGERIVDVAIENFQRSDIQEIGLCPINASAGYRIRAIVKASGRKELKNSIDEVLAIGHANKVSQRYKSHVDSVRVKRLHTLTIGKNQACAADDIAIYFSGAREVDIEIVASEPKLLTLSKLVPLRTVRVGATTVVWTDHYALLHAREDPNGAVSMFINAGVKLERMFSGKMNSKVSAPSLSVPGTADSEVQKLRAQAWHHEVRANALEAEVLASRAGNVWSRIGALWWRPALIDREHSLGGDRRFLLRLIEASGLFDAEFYRANNPDVVASRSDPLRHYLDHGGAEGRAASAVFDSQWYLASNPDVAQARMNPLIHFLCHGITEGRRFNESTDQLPTPRKITPLKL